MLSLLRLVLTRMRSEGIKIQTKKIRLACDVVDFLGDHISADGIRPIPEKVNAMRKIPAPTSVRQVKSVVSALSFYRAFVPDLSTLAEPLNQLLRKGISFVWGAAQDSALSRIRDVFSSDPVLIHPRWEHTPYLACDASAHGGGAVLFFLVDGVERPAAFYSFSFSKPQRRYSAFSRAARSLHVRPSFSSLPH